MYIIQYALYNLSAGGTEVLMLYIDRVLTNALIQMLRLDEILESLLHEFKV